MRSPLDSDVFVQLCSKIILVSFQIAVGIFHTCYLRTNRRTYNYGWAVMYMTKDEGMGGEYGSELLLISSRGTRKNIFSYARVPSREQRRTRTKPDSEKRYEMSWAEWAQTSIHRAYRFPVSVSCSSRQSSKLIRINLRIAQFVHTYILYMGRGGNVLSIHRCDSCITALLFTRLLAIAGMQNTHTHFPLPHCRKSVLASTTWDTQNVRTARIRYGTMSVCTISFRRTIFLWHGTFGRRFALSLFIPMSSSSLSSSRTWNALHFVLVRAPPRYSWRDQWENLSNFNRTAK